MAANVNNYISAGRAAVNSAVKSRAALARNKPRYDELGTEAIKAAADEHVAAMKANAKVANAGLNAIAEVKDTANDAKAAKKVQDIKRGARKAGMLAGGVALLGAGVAMNRKKDEPDAMLSHYDKLRNKYDSQITDSNSKIAEAQAHLDSFKDTKLKGGSTDSSSTSTSTPTGTGGTKAAGGSKTGLRMMNDLIKDGYSPVSAAAIAGNAQHESAGFTAHEEFSPNSYGTKGAGFIQWTNSRRTQFEDWNKNQGLDPTSYEGNYGYLKHEMEGGSGNHWNDGTSTDSFKGIQDLSAATDYYMNNYLRPHEDHQHRDRRQSNAQNLLNLYNSQQS